MLISPLTASAIPQRDAPGTPATSADVIVRLSELAKANDKLTEAFNKASADLAAAERQSAAADHAATAAETALATARHNLALSLAAQYKGASFSHTAALLASNSGQNYIEKMQSLSYLSMHEQEIAAEANQASVQAQHAEATAAKLVADATTKRAALSTQRDVITAEIDKQKQLLASLTAAERSRYLSQGAASPSQVAQVASVAMGSTAGASKAAATAVRVALAQQGKPYVWGASGPGSFDCSGLTMYAWGQAGVGLPHEAAAQQNLGVPVDISQLRPGDLVFFGSPAYHVGMYIGNGMMVHAPTSGDVVRVVSLSGMSDYAGARRVG